jgi:hypothetical protein
MADQYIDRTYLEGWMGSATVDAIVEAGAVNIYTHIEGGTALVQSALRNSGYSVPAATTTDVTVKMAVAGAVWQTLSSVPGVSLKLPEDWKEHQLYVAYTGILNGDVPLTLSLSTIGAVGGSGFTESRTGFSNARPPRAGRDDLAGY